MRRVEIDLAAEALIERCERGGGEKGRLDVLCLRRVLRGLCGRI